MEPDTTIIAGASSWRGTFTQCGGIPRMMAGRMVVAARLHNNNMQRTWGCAPAITTHTLEEPPLLGQFFKELTSEELELAQQGGAW